MSRAEQLARGVARRLLSLFMPDAEGAGRVGRRSGNSSSESSSESSSSEALMTAF